MASVRDIITHVDVEIASKVRICHHNRKEHQISKGEKCLIIRDQNGGKKNYCQSCAVAILQRAKEKISSLYQEIRN